MHDKTALVTGAAGFIGHHLVRFLQEKGYWVMAVDREFPKWASPTADYFDYNCDIREYQALHKVMDTLRTASIQINELYALAADMGGIGYITDHGYSLVRNNAYINLNTAEIARRFKVPRLFFTSSACVYPKDLQMHEYGGVLTEDDAWKGPPDSWYGIEKLMAETIYESLAESEGTIVRIARFHNIYGPEGSWNDGRTKAPAAVCRKIARVALSNSKPSPPIEVWGDGRQTRSFCYIDDCLEMIWRLMRSDYDKPMNIGTDKGVSIDELYDLAAAIAGVEIAKEYDLDKPQGVRRRNADLTLMRETLNYEPQVSLEDGMRQTYEWVKEQIELEERRRAAAKEMTQ